jgi:hypothetical protein
LVVGLRLVLPNDTERVPYPEPIATVSVPA